MSIGKNTISVNEMGFTYNLILWHYFCLLWFNITAEQSYLCKPQFDCIHF